MQHSAAVTLRPMASLWFLRPSPRPGAELTLYCIPHAGGAASAYRAWPACLPDWVEPVALCLPGRESRVREDPRIDAATVAQAIAADCGQRPYAIFGHSMGGLLAFDVARTLRSRADRSPAARGPVHLSISGIAYPPTQSPPQRVSQLPDDRLADWVRELGGVPDWVFEDAYFLGLLLRTLRSDCAWLEAYVHTPADPLPCPMSVFSGAQDESAPEDGMRAWAQETAGRFAVHRYPGTHFYLEQALTSVLGDLVTDLRAALQDAR